MIKNVHRYTIFVCIKRASVVGLIGWSITATILLLRNKPQVLLVGIDQNGTRLITNEDDRLLKTERINFVKRYLAFAYSYSSTDYDSRVSTAGDMMAPKLWEEKKQEFLKISEGLKNEELSQKTKVIEIREIDPENFEADLDINVKSRLKEVTRKLRLQLKLKKSSRNRENPYPFEVESYDEHLIS